MTLQDKINYSINLIQKAEKLALQYSPDGFHLAFSGGKDSQVIYELAKMAGVKFYAQMQITTLDPPELLSFIRKNYPDVIFERPKMNFFELIKYKKMLPTRIVRYCCKYLKEGAGVGKVTIIGVRKSESVKRSKRKEFELSKHKYSGTYDEFNIDFEKKIICVSGKDKILLSPIIEWTDKDVWSFIHANKLPFCKLYEKQKRIGCIFCPMSNKKNKAKDRIKYPGIEKKIKQSIQYLIDNNYLNHYQCTADEAFDWWVSDISIKKYFSQLRTQTKLNF